MSGKSTGVPRGDATKKTKIIDGKRYTLYGWCTKSDYRESKDPTKSMYRSIQSLRTGYAVRFNLRGDIYAIWIRSKK